MFVLSEAVEWLIESLYLWVRLAAIGFIFGAITLALGLAKLWFDQVPIGRRQRQERREWLAIRDELLHDDSEEDR